MDCTRELRAVSLAVACLLTAVACGQSEPPEQPPATAPAAIATAPPLPGRDADRNAYFGDLHVHTQLSFDAFLFGTQAHPDDAYRYAKGEEIDHPAGFKMKLATPLDFQAVTDHSEFMGMMLAMTDPSQKVSQTEFAKPFREAKTIQERGAAFRGMREYLIGDRWKEVLDVDVVRSAWQEVIAAAEKHNDPGKFTTFVGYEFTSAPESQNLHRNVIFRGSKVADLPFTRLDSFNPEELWAWMDRQREAGIESLAIPHNPNGSNGQMFRMSTFDGDPLSAAYAELRMRNEPITEITQVKGTSDTHPLLSPNDEWANFEIMSLRIGATISSDVPGSYVREAYLHGVELDATKGFNPFHFGLIGASDTHNAGGSFDEANFFSKVGLLDATAQRRGSVPLDQPTESGSKYSESYYQNWGAAGLAGVWAEENTRDAIYDGLRRKETFATSGTRMRVRFFAGYDFDAAISNDPAMVTKAYSTGVPMGADLAPRADATPRFLVWAARDAASAALQRVQVIKGWVEDGKAQERVYDVACSDGGVPDASHRCPDNGATVDLTNCSYTQNVGANELKALWQDPDFDATQYAFYYVRVLENPTCRWSTWDAVRAGVAPRDGLATTIQERAWSSPIWYAPG